MEWELINGNWWAKMAPDICTHARSICYAFDTSVEVHIYASTKVLGTILLKKCTAAKYFYPIVYNYRKSKNVQ